MEKVTKIFVTICSIAILFSACTTQKHIVQSTEPLSAIDIQPYTLPVATTPVIKLPDIIQPKPIAPNKSNFEVAYQILNNMLQGNEPSNFEYAVFISENPYNNNKYTYEQFQQTLEIPLYCIERLIQANDKSDSINFDAHVGANGKFKMADMRFLPKEKKELYRKALTNWAIFKYITDTVFVKRKEDSTQAIYYHLPFTYVTKDPFGKSDWANSQVIHLLTSNEQNGNCFAFTALYKILADRLHADAKVCTAPQHIYIQHRDTKGDYYNVELATAGFPDDGTIQALTYTTNEALMNKIALRDYTEKQSIGICMVNLAKSYEHTFDTQNDSFMLKCAETVLKYDSLNLSALLLKQEVLDNSVINYAEKTNNNNNLLLLKKDKTIQQTILDLEKHVALLYRLGYRQMPLDMQQIIMSGNYPKEFKDKNPSPFSTIDPKDAKTAKYHALFGGMFKEVFLEQPSENYGHFVFNTKTKQLQTFDIKAQENDLIDPVAFAYDFGERMYDARLGRFTSTDALTSQFPMWTPYQFAGNRPIDCIDLDGLEPAKIVYGIDYNIKLVPAGDNLNYAQQNVGLTKLQVAEANGSKPPTSTQQQLTQGGMLGTDEFKIANERIKLIGKNAPLVPLAYKALKGQEITKTDVALEAIYFIPWGKVAGVAGKALGPLARFVSSEGTILIKGAGKFGMCKEFAKDFMQKAVPVIESEMKGTAIQKEFTSLTPTGIYQNGKEVTKNGYHTFVEVVHDGKTWIMDNLNPRGVLKDDYVKTLEVVDKQGKVQTGENAYKLFDKTK